jgi:hypothetical protein
MHPATQLRVAGFYAEFEQSILQACSKSPFSIRFPAEALKICSKGSSKDVKRRWSLALPEAQVGARIEEPYSSSYFSYSKYLLLNQFFSSNDLLRLEGKFQKLRMLDISRCFFNIYTHSISWATKDKDFAKENRQKYSFEMRFDELMQHSNYNETAGILVGPEVSRIFAEVILQRVDIELERALLKQNMRSGVNYAIRRYVDDFHIFANEAKQLDIIESCLSDILERYKLFLNSEKSDEIDRPFITSVSRVKYEVSVVCEELLRNLKQPLAVVDDQVEVGDSVRASARRGLDALRHIGGSERAALISSLSDVFKTVERAVAFFVRSFDEEVRASRSAIDDLLGRIKSISRILFYIVSIDLRVPPILRAASILKSICKLVSSLSVHDRDASLAYFAYELSELVGAVSTDGLEELPLEVTNLILLGLMVDHQVFLSQRSTTSVVEEVLSGKFKGYFSTICGLHVIHTAPAFNKTLSEGFVDRIFSLIAHKRFDPALNSEDYLIFCDFLSCPAVDRDRRWKAFKEKIGGAEISKGDFDTLARCMRHINWTDSGTGFELVQKRLPPVYFSA